MLWLCLLAQPNGPYRQPWQKSLEGEYMSSIGSFEAARELVTQPGSLLEVGQVDVAGQSLLGYVNAPASMRDLWMLATGHGM